VKKLDKESWDKWLKELFSDYTPRSIELPPMGLKAKEEWDKIMKEYLKDCKYYGK